MNIIDNIINIFNYNKCKLYDKNKRLCKCCVHYENKTKSCKLFANYDINTGNIEYIPVIVSRNNENLCGYVGNYYKEF